MWGDTIEEIYENLKYKYEKIQREYEDLKRELRKTDDELSSANFRIKHELEPRIESERRSYDNYILSGGDSCFRQGMSGGCGFQCPNFGEEENCKEVISEMSNEELLKYYTDNEAFDSILIVREELINRGLKKEIKDIDEKYCKRCIEDLNKNIESTKQTIKLYEDILANGYHD